MLLGKSVKEISSLIAKGEITTQEVRDYFRDRAERFNEKLNVYLTMNSAEDLKGDCEYKGIPLAVKDNFCTKGLRTTASAKVLDNFVPEYDSTVTSKLEASGFYTLGKTNMDAWAHGSSTETSDYGPTRNPWDLGRVAGGSSGGSAAAVSAYLAPAAIGSETAGSIRQPASWCGIVGMKPTYGRVSRYGVVAMGSSLDSPGPMTLNVEDAALLLGKIAGKDPYDATSVDNPVDNYEDKIKEKKTFTIGISDEYFEGVDEDIKNKVEECIKIFERLGHKTKKIKLVEPKYAISVYTIIQRAEVSSNLARYTGVRYGNDRSFFGKEAKKRVMLGGFTLAHGYYDAYYKKAQKVRTLIIEDFKKAFASVDLILAPSAPVTALEIGESDKYPFFGEVMDVLYEPSSIAGLPAINLPAGLDRKGMPMGIQLMGNYFNESDVMNLGYQFEQETDYFGVIKEGIERWK